MKVLLRFYNVAKIRKLFPFLNKYLNIYLELIFISSFPPRETLQTYDEYLADTIYSLAQLRTLATMNLAQSKYKSKFYYDQRQNIRHSREGEMVYLMKKPKHGQSDQEYISPCEILDINHDTHNAKIHKGNQTKIVHMDLLKRSY